MKDPNSLKYTNGSSPLAVVKRNWRSLFILITLCVDSAAILCSNLVAHYGSDLAASNVSQEPPLLLESTLFFWGVLIFLGLVLGLYRAAYHTKIGQQYFLGAKVFVYSILVILAILFIARRTDYPRAYLVLFFGLLPLLFLLFRVLLNQFNIWAQRHGFGIYNALVVEYEDRLDDVLESRFQSFPELGYRLQGHIARKKPGRKHSHDSLEKLSALLEQGPVDSIFIPTLDIIENGYSDLINVCEERNVRLKVLSPESDNLLRFAYVTDIAGISLYAPPHRKIQFAKRMAKRIFDFCGALIGIVVCIPVFILVPLAILIEDGRPLFFTQRRALTKGGRQFEFLKFRSMEKGAEEQQAALYKINKTTGGLFHVLDDPRLTRVGSFIRKYSLDELPQLFNVLVGDMSLVGPRPLSIGDLSNISPENKLGGYYKLREKGKPGMTGLWQISGRREVGFREMVLLDLYYLEHQTILFDLEILVQTIPVVLFGKGGY